MEVKTPSCFTLSQTRSRSRSNNRRNSEDKGGSNTSSSSTYRQRHPTTKSQHSKNVTPKANNKNNYHRQIRRTTIPTLEKQQAKVDRKKFSKTRLKVTTSPCFIFVTNSKPKTTSTGWHRHYISFIDNSTLFILQTWTRQRETASPFLPKHRFSIYGPAKNKDFCPSTSKNSALEYDRAVLRLNSWT